MIVLPRALFSTAAALRSDPPPSPPHVRGRRLRRARRPQALSFLSGLIQTQGAAADGVRLAALLYSFVRSDWPWAATSSPCVAGYFTRDYPYKTNGGA
jgi:hypothetical protein